MRKKIELPQMRQLLALAGDIQEMQPSFHHRVEHLACGLGQILNVHRVTIYWISFSTSGTEAIPLAEFQRDSANNLHRTQLVVSRLRRLQLEALSRASRVVTSIGVPTWKKPLTLRSMISSRRHLYSVQYCDDGLAIGLLFERRARQAKFTIQEKVIVDTMWHSFRVRRTDSADVASVNSLRRAGMG